MAQARSQGSNENRILLQGFEWYSSPNHWDHLREQLATLKAMGIDDIWLPPGCKAGHVESNGYDTYDLYDLGEFEQKGTRSTKWGSKEELMHLVDAAKEHRVGLIWDTVIGHKAAADRTEVCRAVEVNQRVERIDRRKEIGKWHDIEAWLCFHYPGRGDTYSAMRHNPVHFNGMDFDQRTGRRVIFKLRDWAKDVDKENGNFDYLLCANVDFTRQEVRDDLFHWGQWITKELSLSGFRFDAAKHLSQGFTKEFIDRLNPSMMLIGEYATPRAGVLTKYIERMEHKMSLFDFPLHANLVRLSNSSRPDLRTLLKGALVNLKPQNTVTFVNSHDTQDRARQQEYLVAPWLIPMAYAWILLCAHGHPCVFWGDMFGVEGPGHARPPTCRKLRQLMMLRKLYAHGDQKPYLDEASCVGLTRAGSRETGSGSGFRSGLVLIVTTQLSLATKKMQVGTQHAGESWIDVLQDGKSSVIIGRDGYGVFTAPARSIAVYVNSTSSNVEKVRGS